MTLQLEIIILIVITIYRFFFFKKEIYKTSLWIKIIWK